jgi:hypothetical protein
MHITNATEKGQRNNQLEADGMPKDGDYQTPLSATKRKDAIFYGETFRKHPIIHPSPCNSGLRRGGGKDKSNKR